jgi:endothelin-converting enzyme/putative endopeptidase
MSARIRRIGARARRALSLTAAALLAASVTSGDGAAPVAPLAQLPYTPSLDPQAMDRSVDPCVDLYAFACGGWQKTNPTPPDQTQWSVYVKRTQENQRFLWGLLEEIAREPGERSANRQKLGDYFASCVDEAAIERGGLAPIANVLERIDALASKREIAPLVAELHASTVGSGILFGAGVQQDARDATRQIAAVGAGGLGLPDRDYYVLTDAKSEATRARYRQHVERLLALAGTPPAQAAADAETVLRFETALARATLTLAAQRDPHAIYHRTSLRSLRSRVPHFDWASYFRALGARTDPWLNVAQPAFLRELDAQLAAQRLADWKTILRWEVLDAAAPYLSRAFVEEDFAFHRAHLRGAEADAPRWRKCVAWADRDLGEALGREYVERVFAPETKLRVLEMADQIRDAMRRHVEQLAWMSPSTKRAALAKLAAMRLKVGYPDHWRDYSALSVKRGDFFANVANALRFETRRQLDKIGRPVDREEWEMTPPTVDAYYEPALNDMNFPAGVLLPPLFDPGLDDAPNYGNTGGTIGHELTHGFDDEGRQFDAAGNLRDWWTKSDARRFEERAQCLREQYAGYVVVDELHINSALTSGEDIADLGGEILAYEAWRAQTQGRALEPRDGLTPEQRFFVGFAQWACANERPEELRTLALTDPHSPQRYRVNGVVANMPEFAEAFACKPDAPLRRPPEKICRIW